MSAAASLRVVVVDDDPVLRFALEQGLASHGFDVRCAESPDDALRVVGEQVPDVVLLDRRFGGGGDDGLAACRELRRRHPGCAVVMLTGSDDADDRRAALDAGASAFVTKGTPLEHLASEVARAADAGAV